MPSIELRHFCPFFPYQGDSYTVAKTRRSKLHHLRFPSGRLKLKTHVPGPRDWNDWHYIRIETLFGTDDRRQRQQHQHVSSISIRGDMSVVRRGGVDIEKNEGGDHTLRQKECYILVRLLQWDHDLDNPVQPRESVRGLPAASEAAAGSPYTDGTRANRRSIFNATAARPPTNAAALRDVAVRKNQLWSLLPTPLPTSPSNRMMTPLPATIASPLPYLHASPPYQLWSQQDCAIM